MTMKPLRVGDCMVSAIEEWTGPYVAPLKFMPDATAERIERQRASLQPVHWDPATDLLVFAFQSFVVKTPQHTILIDTCVGNDKERPARPNWHRKNWPWMENLRRAGIEPEAVDYVLCTHLHVDHVGWNTRLVDGRWVPTFPNARYVFARKEYEYWEKRNREEPLPQGPLLEDSVFPIVEAGRATLVETDHQITAGLRLEPTPGHTPGHVCIHLESRGQHAIFVGDMMHHPIQVPEPLWSSGFCTDRVQSGLTRKSFLERHADTDALIVPAHFAGETAGRVRSDRAAFRFEFC